MTPRSSGGASPAPRTGSPGGSEALARQVAGIVGAKGGTDLIAVDVRPFVGYTDFLVICTARNERQARAIFDEVHRKLKEEGRLPARVEGQGDAEWVLADYLDCVLHVFTPATRERYRLEVLWGEAERLELAAADPLDPGATA